MPAYLDFEVSLREVQPKVWRRFLIRSTDTFMDLHEAIQDACGWLNCHLFAFRTTRRRTIAGLPNDDGFSDPDPDASSIKLSSFFGPGKSMRCVYEYDFGDSWEHDVVLKEATDLKERFQRRLTDGGRAFPPEDCGGPPGYEDCVRVAEGFDGEMIFGQADDLREWLGDWTPEGFDLHEVKRHFDR